MDESAVAIGDLLLTGIEMRVFLKYAEIEFGACLMRALAIFLLQANFFPIRHIVVNRAERKSSEVGSWDQEAAEKSASSPPFSGGNSTSPTPARGTVIRRRVTPLFADGSRGQSGTSKGPRRIAAVV
jgi:hypothetical protein